MATACGSVMRVISPPIGPNDWTESKLLTLALWNPRCAKKYDLKLSELKSMSTIRRNRLFCLRVLNCSSHSVDRVTVDNPLQEDLLLKAKGQEVAILLNGRSTYLIGMMGCGKTTVAKVLSKALGYSFVDSDSCVVEANGGTSVREIFELGGENLFRVYETEELGKLSMIPKQVVATGGGAFTSPINREYMNQGITVFLDVPIDVLAKRLAADGGDRPLLKLKSRDLDEIFAALNTLMKERGEDYSKATITVSLQQLAVKLGIEDASKISEKTIALQILEQIEDFVKDQKSRGKERKFF